MTSSGVISSSLPIQKLAPGAQTFGNHFRQTAAKVRRLKDVFEDAFDIDPRAFVRINAKRAKTKVQRADVVETKNVIGVTVSDQNSVEMLQSEAQRLLAKVGRRIDENGRPACSMMIETLRRLSRGSSEMQVSHSQPIDGTPVEVPVPKKVSFISPR